MFSGRTKVLPRFGYASRWTRTPQNEYWPLDSNRAKFGKPKKAENPQENLYKPVKPYKTNLWKPIKNYLIIIIVRLFSYYWIPGSEPIHLDLEKLFLLSDSMENLKFGKKTLKFQNSKNKSEKLWTFPIRTPFWDELEMSSG